MTANSTLWSHLDSLAPRPTVEWSTLPPANETDEVELNVYFVDARDGESQRRLAPGLGVEDLRFIRESLLDLARTITLSPDASLSDIAAHASRLVRLTQLVELLDAPPEAPMSPEPTSDVVIDLRAERPSRGNGGLGRGLGVHLPD